MLLFSLSSVQWAIVVGVALMVGLWVPFLIREIREGKKKISRGPQGTPARRE